MENRFNRFPSDFEKEEWQNWRHKHSRLGRVLGGIVIVAVGGLLLANQLGTIILPAWAFTWQMGLIVLGVYMGAKHVFKHPVFLLPIVVGGLFLMQDINPASGINFIHLTGGHYSDWRHYDLQPQKETIAEMKKNEKDNIRKAWLKHKMKIS